MRSGREGGSVTDRCKGEGVALGHFFHLFRFGRCRGRFQGTETDRSHCGGSGRVRADSNAMVQGRKDMEGDPDGPLGPLRF